jgi:hypothetical protein
MEQGDTHGGTDITSYNIVKDGGHGQVVQQILAKYGGRLCRPVVRWAGSLRGKRCSQDP